MNPDQAVTQRIDTPARADHPEHVDLDHLFASAQPRTPTFAFGEEEEHRNPFASEEEEEHRNPGVGARSSSARSHGRREYAGASNATLQQLNETLRAIGTSGPQRVRDPLSDWAKKAALRGLKADSLIDPNLTPLQMLYKLAATRDLLPASADPAVAIEVMCARLSPITRQRMETRDREAFCGRNVVVWLRLLLRAHQMSETEISELLLTEHAERLAGEGAVAHLARFEALALISGSSLTIAMGRYTTAVLKNASWSRQELEREARTQELFFGMPAPKTPRDMLAIVESLDRKAPPAPPSAPKMQQAHTRVLQALVQLGAKLPQGTACATCSGDHATRDCLKGRPNRDKREREAAQRCSTCFRKHGPQCFFVETPEAAQKRAVFKEQRGVLLSANPAHVAQYGATLVDKDDSWSNLNKRFPAKGDKGNRQAKIRRIETLLSSEAGAMLLDQLEQLQNPAGEESNKPAGEASDYFAKFDDGVQVCAARSGAVLGVPAVPVELLTPKFEVFRRVERAGVLGPKFRLVDSGAQRSCVHPAVLPAEILARIEQADVTSASGFEGSVTTVLGKVRVDMRIGSSTAAVDLLVVPALDGELLLGMDAIVAFGIIIDGRERCVRLGNEKWPIPTSVEDAWISSVHSLRTQGAINLRLPYTVTVPAKSQVVVLTEGPSLGLPIGSTLEMMVGPVRSNAGQPRAVRCRQEGAAECKATFENSFLFTARGAARASVERITLAGREVARLLVPVVVANFGDEPLVIQQGERVAVSEELAANAPRVCKASMEIGDGDLTVSDVPTWEDADQKAFAAANVVSPPTPDDHSRKRLLELVELAVASTRQQPGVTDQMAAQLEELLTRTIVDRVKFDPDKKEVPMADVEPIVIQLRPGSRGVAEPRRVTSPEGERFKQQTEQGFLEMGIVEKCESSEWAAAVHLARKKNGDFRYCIDLRNLNRHVMAQAYPLPTCQELIDTLQGAQFFTTLDAVSGFWQMPLAPESRHLTAFRSARHGLLQMCRLPMGLLTASAEFQKRIEQVLAGMTWEICLCYVDDIVVYSKTWEEHLVALDRVLTRLTERRITINL